MRFLPGKTAFLVRVNMLPDVSEKLVPRKIMFPVVVMMNLPSPMTFSQSSQIAYIGKYSEDIIRPAMVTCLLDIFTEETFMYLELMLHSVNLYHRSLIILPPPKLTDAAQFPFLCKCQHDV